MGKSDGQKRADFRGGTVLFYFSVVVFVFDNKDG